METSAVFDFVLKAVTYSVCLFAAIILVYYAVSQLIKPTTTLGQFTAVYLVIQVAAIIVMLTNIGNPLPLFWANTTVALNNSMLMTFHGKSGNKGSFLLYIVFVLIHAILAIGWIS